MHIIVPPTGLQTSSAPWVLSLAGPLGTLCSFYWLAVSHGYFDPLSNKDQSMYTLVFLLLELHILLEPWVPPCVLLGWWFSPWELWGFLLVHIVVLPADLQNSSSPWALSLVVLLGTICSFYWLAVIRWYFDPLSNKDQSIHNLIFLLLELHVVCELYLGYSELWG